MGISYEDICQDIWRYSRHGMFMGFTRFYTTNDVTFVCVKTCCTQLMAMFMENVMFHFVCWVVVYLLTNPRAKLLYILAFFFFWCQVLVWHFSCRRGWYIKDHQGLFFRLCLKYGDFRMYFGVCGYFCLSHFSQRHHFLRCRYARAGALGHLRTLEQAFPASNMSFPSGNLFKKYCD